MLIRKLGEAAPDYESWFREEPDLTKTPRLEITKANDVFSLRLLTDDDEDNSDDDKESEIVTTAPPTSIRTPGAVDKMDCRVSQLLSPETFVFRLKMSSTRSPR